MTHSAAYLGVQSFKLIILIIICAYAVIFQRGGGRPALAVSSSPRPWIDVFALPEKSNIAVTESDLDPMVRKMSITF